MEMYNKCLIHFVKLYVKIYEQIYGVFDNFVDDFSQFLF